MVEPICQVLCQPRFFAALPELGVVRRIQIVVDANFQGPEDALDKDGAQGWLLQS